VPPGRLTEWTVLPGSPDLPTIQTVKTEITRITQAAINEWTGNHMPVFHLILFSENQIRHSISTTDK
jgi:hypothetical protein